MTTSYIGQPIRRVDGRAKVTAAAKYAGESNVPNLACGHVVSAAIAKGRIRTIDPGEALKLEGVLHVFTHNNAPKLAGSDRNYQDDDAPAGSPFRPLHDDEILYSGQPIALVVAETFEPARYASTLIRIEYERDSHVTDLDARRHQAREPRTGNSGYEPPPKPRGNPEKALANAAVQMRAPGAALGVYALECAMDELAYELRLDPLELRLKNYAERDQNKDKPFSSKELRECYRQGAERFGWANRSPEPRSRRDGDRLIGWGVATGVWEASQHKAAAKAVLDTNGKLTSNAHRSPAQTSKTSRSRKGESDQTASRPEPFPWVRRSERADWTVLKKRSPLPPGSRSKSDTPGWLTPPCLSRSRWTKR
jgi:CO/xanthine dehydrogenase Mo-binding subunit